MAHIPHIVILGGGFGGLAAATEIREKLDPEQAEITVIDKKDWFMVGFAKLWILNGTRTFEDSTASLYELQKKGIGFLKEEVSGIDLQEKTVRTAGRTVSYDYLVISMGAVLQPQKVPGLADNGYNLYDHGQLLEIREKLQEIDSGKVAILITKMPYKCPPAPFEASLLIASMLQKMNKDNVEIHVYGPAPMTLPAAGPETSKKILELVSSEQVVFHDSCKIKSVEQKRMIFEDKEDGFDLLLAVPPHAAPSVIYDCGLAEAPGFVPVNRDCKTDHDGVYAIGDVTSMTISEKAAVPKAGVFAEGQGMAVAQNIVSRIKSQAESAVFDGKGGCFIESGRDTASVIEVDAFAENGPVTRLTESTAQNLAKKREFESERLKRWL